MISSKAFFRSTAALCAIVAAGVSLAGDGVVRMSDRSASSSTSATGEGVVRMSGSSSAVQQVGLSQGSCGEQGCDSCNTGSGYNGSCYTPMDCNTCFAGTDTNGMPSCWCSGCGSSPCQCRGKKGRGSNYNTDVTLFAKPMDSGTGSACRDFWHGNSMSFRNKNARLSNKLFGWMIPSGCCGQGCPPIGKYHMTYADQPGYMDPRDGQIYAAQGYNMPMSVPLAPNVNHAYNYSSGIPASRVTTIGNYNPMTAPQQLNHQSW